MSWLIALIITKWLFYLGVAALIGGSAMGYFFQQKQLTSSAITNSSIANIFRWQTRLFLAALLCVMAVVPLNAAMLAENGLQGLWDPLMLSIVWDSNIGSQSLLRMLAMASALVAQILLIKQHVQVAKFMYGLSIVVIAVSFTLSGHPAEVGLLAQGLIALHIVMACWWVGSLGPLITACTRYNTSNLQQLLHLYGQQAMLWVGLLIISGGVLFVYLISATEGPISRQYLVVMGLKLSLVVAMLGFAAHHKWQLVKRIEQPGHATAIKRSIIQEGLIGLSILILTALLTTAVGIAGD